MESNVTITKDVLSDALIKKIKTESTIPSSLSTNLTSWQSELIGASGAVLIYTIKDDLLKELTFEIAEKFPITKEYKLTASYYLGSRLSYIQWHTDTPHKFAMTIYVNNHWDKNWSGSFVHRDIDERIIAIYPEYNISVSFTPPVWHASNMPTLLAPLRETIQIFCD
jgi:hypothetical protein